MATERPPGGDFGPPFAVAPAKDFESLKGVAIAPSGAAVIAYGHTPIRVAVRLPGRAFGAPRRIGTVIDYINPIGLGVNDRGDAVAAWPAADNGIQAAFRAARQRTWRRIELAPKRPLLPVPGNVPSVVVDSSGRATGGWEETNGAVVHTYTRGFGAAGVGTRVQVDAVPSYVREGPPEACRPPDAQIAQDSGYSTVFEQNNRVYGCLAARGAPVLLSEEQDYYAQSLRRVALAGGLVAYGEDFYGADYESSIVVSDLRDLESGFGRGASLASTGTAELAAVRLKSNGAVAWVSCPRPDFPFPDTTYACQNRGGDRKQVWVWPRHRLHPQLVDRGRMIDPRSFRLRGSRLSWRNGRAVHHARLP
jgi:hypothetical protein